MKRTRRRYQPKRKKGWGLIVFILIAAGIIFCMGKAGLPESWEKEQLLPQLKQAEEVMARVFGQEEEEKPDETSGIRQDPSEDMPWLAAEFLENALPETLRQGRPFEEENSVAASAQEAPGAGEEEIKEYLAGNLCRCSGYMSQLRAVKKYLDAKAQADAEEGPDADTRGGQ